MEAVARRNRMAPRPLLPALGLAPADQRTAQLVCGLPPQALRRAEALAGLDPGRLDGTVGDRLAPAGWLAFGGSRFCPACLAEGGGRWQLRWRLSWVFACPRHHRLLADACPACGGTQRVRLAGGTAVPAATCTRGTGGHRCGADLATAEAGAATPAVLAAQCWVDSLLAGPGPAGAVFADLPAVASWLLRHSNIDALDGFGEQAAASWQRYQALLAAKRPGMAGHQPADAPLAAAGAGLAQVVLGPDDGAAVDTIAALLTRLPTKLRNPPPGMDQLVWKQLASPFPNRYLRAADPAMRAGDRLRLRSPTPRARPAATPAAPRVRFIPQLLWPDWASRLLPPTRHPGLHAEQFRAVASACLLLPGEPTHDYRAVAARLNPRLRGWQISQTLQAAVEAGGTAVLAALCHLADHLDEVGSPIDYQHRRAAVPTATITRGQWQALSLRAGAHPGDADGLDRLVHAQRHLYQLLTGADLNDPAHTLAYRTRGDRSRYLHFTASLTSAQSQALRTHAQAVLDDLGTGEPLTWSPPPQCCHGLALPGFDPGEPDLDTIHRIVTDEGRPLGDAADHLHTSTTTSGSPSNAPPRSPPPVTPSRGLRSRRPEESAKPMRRIRAKD